MQTQAVHFNQNLETATVQHPVLLTKQERHELLLQILKTSLKKPCLGTRHKMSSSTKMDWKPTKNTGKSGVSFNQA